MRPAPTITCGSHGASKVTSAKGAASLPPDCSWTFSPTATPDRTTSPNS
ncbi:hypothetical protein H4W33_004202 [Kibdelosporangium phytohabitans]|nr:hypothetical protein [Kibdelosporangium phytohabitans]MBE1465190.1 hypothetical protein [Kibdelosporangium phytohabitans]